MANNKNTKRYENPYIVPQEGINGTFLYEGIPVNNRPTRAKSIVEAALPAIETAIKNFRRHLPDIASNGIATWLEWGDSNEVRPIPKHSAENIKDQTSFMLNKYLQEQGYNNTEEYFKDHPTEKYIKLPYTAGWQYHVKNDIPIGSTEYGDLTDEPNTPKDFQLSMNYLDYWDSRPKSTTTRTPSMSAQYAKHFKEKTGLDYNQYTNPQTTTVGKYDAYVYPDGTTKISDDYDFDLTKEEWKKLLKGSLSNKARALVQPILGTRRTFIQELEFPTSEIE